VAVLIYLSSFLVRGVRWQLLLSKKKRISLKRSVQIIILGYAANNLLPFRLGEVVRAVVLATEEKLSKIFCLSTILVERFLDAVTLVCILALSLLMLSGVATKQQLYSKLLIVAVVMVVGILAIAVVSIKGEWLIAKVPSAKIREVLSHVKESFKAIESPMLLLKVVVLSLLVWFIEGLVLVYLLHVIGVPNSFVVGLFCLGVLNLGILVPSAPGYIGIFQASIVFAFTLLKLDPALGLAFSIVLHVIQYSSISLIGILIFQFSGISLNRTLCLIKERK
jgi:uncharacterized protein (TIRG00374 family)